MEVFVTASVSFCIDLDDIVCYNIQTGEMTKNLPDETKLQILNGVNDTWTIVSFYNLIEDAEVKDYDIIDVEVEG